MPVKVVFSKISTDLITARAPPRLRPGRIFENLHLDSPPFRPPPLPSPAPATADRIEQCPGVSRFAVFRLGALLRRKDASTTPQAEKILVRGRGETTLRGVTDGQ